MHGGATPCGAKTQGKGPCKNPAGHRTTHPGRGRCCKHGAGKKAKPGGGRPANKNAVTTGEYETLHLSALPPEQQALYRAVDITPMSQAEQSLRLICVREHRILLKISKAEAAGNELGMLPSSRKHEIGWGGKGKVDLITTETAPILQTIMALEDSLTRIGTLKMRAIEKLSAERREGSGEGNVLRELVDIIDRSAEDIVRAEAEAGKE